MPLDPSKASVDTVHDTLLVDLALQGGGSHGAFTWGVLDRLLEEPWLRIDGISGTSAGAMNAVVLADGYAAGGPEGARTASNCSGDVSRTPPDSVPFGAAPWIFCWADGRSTTRRSLLPSIWPRGCSRLTT